MCNSPLGNSNSITHQIFTSWPVWEEDGKETIQFPDILVCLCHHSSCKSILKAFLLRPKTSEHTPGWKEACLQAGSWAQISQSGNKSSPRSRTISERQILLKSPWHHRLSLWFSLSIFLRRGRSPSTCALVCSLCWDHSMGYFCKLSDDQTEKIVFLRLPLKAGHDSRAQYPSIFAYPGRVVGCSACPVHPMRRAARLGLAVSPWYEPP